MVRSWLSALWVGVACAVALDPPPLPCHFYEQLRPTFHFIPEDGWMNDPNGPFFDPVTKIYHFMYQANPNATCNQNPWGRGVNQMWGPKWSGMRWGHAVSKDLLAWTHLPIAINHWDEKFYDCQPWPAIFSGSTTMIGEDPLVFYSVPCQNWVNGAVPANRSDPLLVDWKKLGPVFNASDSITKGSGVDVHGYDWGTTFRDPTTAWQDETGKWFAVFACMNGTCLFTKNASESPLKGVWKSSGWFHHVASSGAWECPDVFQLQLPDSDNYTYVLKANTAQGSMCVGDSPNNWWATGDFNTAEGGGFVPHSEEICGDHFDGKGNHFDYGGNVYASKSFFDPAKKRQILTSWVKEAVPLDKLNISWSGLAGLPRLLSLDPSDPTFVLSYPIDELASLRGTKRSIGAFGQKASLPDSAGPKLDVDAVFNVSLKRQSQVTVTLKFGKTDLDMVVTVAANGSAVLDVNEEYTSAPFALCRGSGCEGVPPPLQLRAVLDHSVLEVFAQGGRAVHTARIYDPSMGKGELSVKVTDTTHRIAAGQNPTSSSLTIVKFDVYEMADATPDPELERLAALAFQERPSAASF